MTNQPEPEEDDLKFWHLFIKDLKPIKQSNKNYFIKPLERKQQPTATDLQKNTAPPPNGLVPEYTVTNHKLIKPLLKNLKHTDYRTLDLHNYTLDEAFVRLTIFIKQNYTYGHKILLIITGKGLGDENTIQVQLPRWLMYTKIRKYIKHYAPADCKHGGNGAIFVILRCKPPES